MRLIIESRDTLAWSLVTYYVFDAPSISMPFRHRLSSMLAYFKCATSMFAKFLHHDTIVDSQSLNDLIDKSPCEGIIIRNPNSLYDRKRSWSMIKLKRWQDADCQVISVCKHPQTSNRRHLNSMADSGRPAIIVKAAGTSRSFVLVNGIDSKIINTINGDIDKAIVTVKFNGFDHRGMPRQPVFHRFRLDA